ncbi:MAG: hypothetical protein MZW92_22125 [Comamonadaceae bacterium]|nr:hypothetical protein [Comamonadaceae bacterium]
MSAEPLQRHPHPRRPPEQPQESRPEHPPERAGRRHRSLRVRGSRPRSCSTRSTPRASGATSRPSPPYTRGKFLDRMDQPAGRPRSTACRRPSPSTRPTRCAPRARRSAR